MISSNNKNWIINLIIIFHPFILLFWLSPFSNHTIGNDYSFYPILHQLELYLSLKMGSFPLYVPSFATGNNITALTLGQLYHPISIISSKMPFYWDGKCLEWNTLFRLLSLGFAQLYLYSFLRKFKLSNFWSYLLSLITVYNLRMLDLFRYGASLESWTGFLFTITTLLFLFNYPNINKFKFTLIFAIYWLITSGHPQMVYYAFIGVFIFIIM